MLIKKSITFAVFAMLAFAGSVFAQGNSILNTTLRTTGNNNLNLTFFTKADNAEKPIVKNKGNNKYIILLPNMADSSGHKPDLRAVSDVVSDVEVKTISEGAITYTKVSLTTKKTVNVKAETRKTTQSATELSGVNNIVSKVNLISNDIQESKNIQPVAQKTQKTQTTQAPQASPALPKLSGVQDILRNKNLIVSASQSVPSTPKKETPNIAPKIMPVNTVASHVPSNTKEIKNNSKNLANENISNKKVVKPEEKIKNEPLKVAEKISKPIFKQNKEEKTKEKIAPVIKNEVVKSVETKVQTVENTELALPPLNVEAEPASEITEIVPESMKPSKNPLDKISSVFLNANIKKYLTSPTSLISLVIAGGLFLLMFIFSKVRASLVSTDKINSSFIKLMNNAPVKKHNVSDVTDDNGLSWQEKYNNFKGRTAKQQREEVNNYNGFVEQDDDIDIVEDMRSLNSFEVSSDEDSISRSMKRSLKAFGDDRELKMTQRTVGLPNRFKSFDTDNSNVLQRNMSELLDTMIQLGEEKSAVAEASNLSELLRKKIEQVESKEVQKAEQSQEISEFKPISIKPREHKETVANSTSPIEKPSKKKMKILQSKLIEDNKGFYLVDMDDKLALMGRIDGKFNVLKKFSDKEKTTLQVRRDRDNLYMVRTDGFKALVNVSGTKMGIFAEL